jgi:hypothetical protein
MNQCQRVVVVHGSGQILNWLCKDIMQSSQWLLDALGSHRWNAVAIEGQLKLMSSMIKERHEHGVVHAYVDQKFLKSNIFKSFNQCPKHRV